MSHESMLYARFCALRAYQLERWLEADEFVGFTESRVRALRNEMTNRGAETVGDLPANRVAIHWGSSGVDGELPIQTSVECPECGRRSVLEPGDYLCTECRRALDGDGDGFRGGSAGR